MEKLNYILTSTTAGSAGSVQLTKVSEGIDVPFDPIATI